MESSRPERILKVCSDPNNLPFSNQKAEGFENRIAQLLAREMGARVEYTWFPQRRGFVRNTLRAGLCDVIIGVPADFDPVATTKSYYRSSYVFLSRPDHNLHIRSLNDDVLRRVKIGVHVVGDDYANTPPVHALSRRKIVQNVVGFTLYGDYAQPNPPARLVEAVTHGDIDVAVVWGPLGGYFAHLQSPPLQVTPVSPELDTPTLPLAFDIAMGVRRDDKALRRQLDDIIDRRRGDLTQILDEFHIPYEEPLGVSSPSPSESGGQSQMQGPASR